MPPCWISRVRECVRACTLAVIGLCSKALRHPNKCLVLVPVSHLQALVYLYRPWLAVERQRGMPAVRGL